MPNLPLFPPEASSLAGKVDHVFFFALIVSVFFATLIAVLIIYFGIRYRRRSPDEVGIPEKGSLWLEFTWSVIPLAIMMVLFVWGTKLYFAESRPPSNAIEFQVVAKQWMWKIQHPEGNREIDEVHVPLGKAIRLNMTSQDVIHSFFVPAFRVKADVLPDRYTTTWFRATKLGTYHLFCAQYCGAEHSRMIGKVIVMTPANYQKWLKGTAPAEQPAASGETLFTTTFACSTCHRSDSAARAPILNGLLGRKVQLEDGSTIVADENYVRQSILNSQAQVVKGYQPIMPLFKGQISPGQLEQLVSYIKSLKPSGAAAAKGGS